MAVDPGEHEHVHVSDRRPSSLRHGPDLVLAGHYVKPSAMPSTDHRFRSVYLILAAASLSSACGQYDALLVADAPTAASPRQGFRRSTTRTERRSFVSALAS